MWRIFFFAILLMCWRVHAEAPLQPGTFKSGFIRIHDKQELWIEQREARNGKPTIFLLNGLDYTTRSWRQLVKSFTQIDPDLGIVLYDMQGQGETFLRDTKQNRDIPYDVQREDLKLLADRLNIKGDKYLVGLSYGGGLVLKYLAKYPNDFKAFISMAPFIEQLTNIQVDVSDQISAMISMFNNPYKASGIYHMIGGARDWNATQILDQIPNGKLHLIAGLQDRMVLIQSLRKFWQSLPPGAGASYLEIDGASHRMPELVPEFIAAWIHKIMSNNPPHGGLTFQGNVKSFEATHEKEVFPLTNPCAEDLKNKTKG